MRHRAFALSVVAVLVCAVIATAHPAPMRLAATPVAGSPAASPQMALATSPVSTSSSPTPNVLATVQARATATFSAQATEAVVQATEASRAATATTMAMATEAARQATEASLAATAAVNIAATATAAAASAEQTVGALQTQVIELQGALALLATSEASAAQAAATAEATAAVLSTQVANIALTATANAVPTATPTRIPTSTPEPTATPTGEPEAVLYQANWSGGLSGWHGSQDWKVVEGMLVNDGTNQDIYQWIAAPYASDTADYAIEAEIQAVRPPARSGCSGNFGLRVRVERDGGYQSQVDCDMMTIRVSSLGDMSQITESSFALDDDWHVYRVEVKSNRIKFLIDGSVVVDIIDNRYLSKGQVGINSHLMQINVRSFKVIAL